MPQTRLGELTRGASVCRSKNLEYLMTPLRPLISLISTLVLLVSIYLLWTWWQGEVIQRPDNTFEVNREPWRLWVGGALLAWSLLGRWPIMLLLARRDTDPMQKVSEGGEVIAGADGEELHIYVQGPPNAPVILMTHGWSLDHSVWQYAARDLSKEFRVVTWDLPGLGRSTASKISLSNMAANLQIIVTQLQKPVVLVGHSIGGMTIQTLMRDHPDVRRQAVAGVVLVDTTYTNPLRTIILSPLLRLLRWPLIEPLMWLQIIFKPLAWLMSWQSYLSGSMHLTARLGYGAYVTRSQLEHTAWLMTTNSPSVQARGDLAMFRWDATEALPDISVPTLVLAGEADIVTKPGASRRIARVVPDASLKTFQHVNHMGFLERAQDYNAAIRDFARIAFSAKTNVVRLA
jgi:pimeloyl-ACP methyl ester carboxylesterase